MPNVSVVMPFTLTPPCLAAEDQASSGSGATSSQRLGTATKH